MHKIKSQKSVSWYSSKKETTAKFQRENDDIWIKMNSEVQKFFPFLEFSFCGLRSNLMMFSWVCASKDMNNDDVEINDSKIFLSKLFGLFVPTFMKLMKTLTNWDKIDVL